MTKVTLHKVVRPGSGGRTRVVWTLRWYGTDGRRLGQTIGDTKVVSKREAEAARRELQSKLDCGVAKPDKPKRMTLEDFLRRDREAVAIDVKPKTIKELEMAAAHAIDALGRNLDIRKLDYAAVGRIKQSLAQKELASATICKVVRHLQGAFSRGLRLNLVEANPFAGVKLPKVQPRAARTYSDLEVAAMLKVAPDLWWEALIRLAYTSGFRLGEMMNLMWADLDLDAGTAGVAPKKKSTFVLGGRSYPILPWTSKSYENRTVPIPEETIAALRRLKARSAGSPYVFLTLERLDEIGAYLKTTGGVLDANYKLVGHLHEHFYRLQAAAAARLAEGRKESARPNWERRSFHDFRRSYGTVMARHVPMHELKALMGHSSIKTTEAHYLAASDVSAKVRKAFGTEAARAS